MCVTLHPLPHYKWYWEKFRLSRRVRKMDYIQRGLYRDLLDEQWENGSVSGDIEDMADICGCPLDIMASAWQVLEKCFDLVGDCYKNAFLEQQRTETDKLRIVRSESGKQGGVAKSQRNQDESGKCQAPAKQVLAPSQDKIREEEIRGDKKRENTCASVTPSPHTTRFQKPSVDEVREYCKERNNSVDPERFHAYYESNGWKVGKNPMKNWKSAIVTWEKGDNGKAAPKGLKQYTPEEEQEYLEAFDRKKELRK